MSSCGQLSVRILLRVVGIRRTVATDGEGSLRGLGAPCGEGPGGTGRRAEKGVRRVASAEKAVQCAGSRRFPGEGAWVRDKIAAKGPECAILRPRGVDARPKCSQGQRVSDFRFFSRIGKGSTSISRAFGRLRRAPAHRGPFAAAPQPPPQPRPRLASRLSAPGRASAPLRRAPFRPRPSRPSPAVYNVQRPRLLSVRKTDTSN